MDANNSVASDQNAGTKDRPWKTIAKANQTLRAGDTVNILSGSYTTSYINPSSSGTSESRITYRNYGTDAVTISGQTYAVYLNGKDYITVQGIKAQNCTHFLYLVNDANYNIINNCSFDNNNNADWNHSVIYASHYNWIHHCQFSKGGSAADGGNDNGSVLDIGDESGSSYDSNIT